MHYIVPSYPKYNLTIISGCHYKFQFLNSAKRLCLRATEVLELFASTQNGPSG